MAHTQPRALWALGFLGALLLWGMTHLSTLAQEPNTLPFGVPVTGDIQSAEGDEWQFNACAGSVVTVTMQSAEFTPYLELYTADGALPLVEVNGVDDSAAIDGFAVEETGSFLVVAAGRRRSDRGTYELHLTTALSTTSDSQEAVDGVIAPGSEVSGTIRARQLAAWGFQGCAGDAVTIQAISDDFDVFVELFHGGDDDVLAEDDNSGRSSDAEIAEFILPASGNYTILVSGATRLDAGVYTLILDLEAGDGSPAASAGSTGATATRTSTATRSVSSSAGTTRTPTRTRTPVATRTPTAAPASSAATCTVQSSTLNVRSGPGTEYTPPVGSLRRGTVVEMVARNGDSTWVQIEDSVTGLNGWVNATLQFVVCTKPVASLELGVVPPTPTAEATVTPTSTPTTAPAAVVRIPTPPTEIGIGGGGGAGLSGTIQADISMVTGTGDNIVFSRQVYFRMLVWDPDLGNYDGTGIEHTEFEIKEQFGNQRIVHTQRENTASYCSFGGGEPNCNILELHSGAKWPSTGIPIENGRYTLEVTAFRDNGNSLTWDTDFTIDMQSSPAYGGGGNNSGGGGSATSFILYEGNPASNNPKLCSGFRTDCSFGDSCANDQRLVYGPYCRAETYSNIREGLYRVRLEGSGSVDAGATDWGPAQDNWSFGKQRLNLPGEYTFCWPGLAANGQGFEIMVKNIGQSAKVDRIIITWLSDSC